MEEERDKERGGLVVLPPVPGGEGAASGFSSAAQIGAPGVAGLPAGAQAGALDIPGMPAAAQSATLGLPSIPAGPQWGVPSIPSVPGGAQTGSAALQGAGHGLLGTLSAKLIAAALVVVVVAGGTTALLAATRTKIPLFGSGGSGSSQTSAFHPSITVMSDYHVGATPAGTTTNVLHVSGTQFAANSAITFLLDGTPVAGAPAVESDAKGAFTADLTITADWAVGKHTLTAKDARGNRSQRGISVIVVAQGQAHTPGPNGAPPDDASFRITLTFNLVDHLPGNPQNLVLIIGHPDPMGGTACGPLDDGQPHTYPDPDTPGVTDTFTTTCSGSYQRGGLIYTESLMQSSSTDSNGLTCTIATTSPWTYQFEGAFTGPTTSSGMVTVSHAAEQDTCSDGSTSTVQPITLTSPWTGTLSTTS